MASPTLILDHVSYAFSPEKWAVRDISAAFLPGKLTVLIGPNGSGKTTLLRLAAGLLPIRSGKVMLDNREVARIQRKERARLIALLPQREESLPDMTAIDMVLLGRTPHLSLLAQDRPQDRDMAMAAMEKTGVATLHDRPLATLSGGELQRVAIARALCQDTPVLLLDEPVASLDIGHQAAVMELLSHLTQEQNLCVACVLHDLNLAAHFADHVVLLSGGELLKAGEPEAVLTEELLLSAYGVRVYRLSSGNHFALTPDFGKTYSKNLLRFP
jgi:iron complex transport system ATP-binding protein